ncbi:MAG: hypothetical protein ACRD4C_12040 [Candidatus Acidiferrales bacterium]
MNRVNTGNSPGNSKKLIAGIGIVLFCPEPPFSYYPRRVDGNGGHNFKKLSAVPR